MKTEHYTVKIGNLLMKLGLGFGAPDLDSFGAGEEKLWRRRIAD